MEPSFDSWAAAREGRAGRAEEVTDLAPSPRRDDAESKLFSSRVSRPDLDRCSGAGGDRLC